MNPEIIVSVLCICYNQEKYIRDALEGFVNQKTNFNYEVIISDDASADNTQNIIKEYQMNYPNIIKPIYRKENIGANSNFMDSYNKCKGKYVAICDGDDYWTDQKKLQKQIDFLEKNQDFAMSSHAVKTIYLDVEEKYPFVEPLEIAGFEEIIRHGLFIPSLSIVISRKALPKLPIWFEKLWSSHMPIILLSTVNGKNYYFKEIMGLKRKNPKSISQLPERKTRRYKEYLISNKTYFLKKLNKYSNYRYNKIIKKIIAENHIKLMYISWKRRNVFNIFINLYKSFFYDPSQLIEKGRNIKKYL